MGDVTAVLTVNVLSVVLFDVVVVSPFSLWITGATKHTFS